MSARLAACPAALAWLLLAAGCKSPPEYREADQFYFQDRPAELMAAYHSAEADPEVNSLLGINKMLSAALLAFDWQEAERLAEIASSRVNIFLAGEKGERDALSFLGQEKDKPWKGEPHERGMVDFYLGLLRYRRGDHEGAYCAFLSALAKDRGIYRLPVEKERARRDADNAETYLYSPDYATFSFFAACAALKVGEPEEAARHLEDAKRIHPELAGNFDQGVDPRSNVLVVIEAGQAPMKERSGPRGENLVYRQGSAVTVEEVRFAGSHVPLAMTDDLYLQASTLGGRAVDELNRLKASRQEALKAAGFATAMAGGILASAGDHHGNRDMQTAGLIALGVGIAAMIFAEAAVDPSADVRTWNLLPGRIYVAAGRLPPGEHDLEIRAHGEHGGDHSQRWTGVRIEPGRQHLLWFRLLPSVKGGPYPNEGGRAAPEPPVNPETVLRKES